MALVETGQGCVDVMLPTLQAAPFPGFWIIPGSYGTAQRRARGRVGNRHSFETQSPAWGPPHHEERGRVADRLLGLLGGDVPEPPVLGRARPGGASAEASGRRGGLASPAPAPPRVPASQGGAGMPGGPRRPHSCPRAACSSSLDSRARWCRPGSGGALGRGRPSDRVESHVFLTCS